MAPRSNALPKYVQTAEMLIREIASGRLADGARLPPERNMASELGIAVGTLRKALHDLQDRGLLRRIHGSGNYVCHRPDAAGVYAFFRLELIEGGGLPTASVLGVGRVATEGQVAAVFDGREAYRIRRLRSLSGTPVALEEIWLDGRRAERIDASDLSESLYLHYRNKLNLPIASVEDRIGVAAVPGWTVPAFGLIPGLPAGFVERRGRTPDGEIAEFSRTWFDPDKAQYVNRHR